MDKTIQLTFVSSRYGDYSATITDRNHRVSIYDTCSLGVVKHLIQALRHLSLVLTNRATNHHQLWRGTIAYLSLVIHKLIYAAHHIGEDTYTLATLAQTGILLLRAVHHKADHISDSSQRTAQHNHLLGGEKCALDTNLGQHALHIGELVAWRIGVEHKQCTHLVGNILLALNLGTRSRKLLASDNLARSLHTAQSRNLLTQTVETYLLLKICGINHH